MSRDSCPGCLARSHWWGTDKTPFTRAGTVLVGGQFPRCCLQVPTYLRAQSNGKPQVTARGRRFRFTRARPVTNHVGRRPAFISARAIQLADLSTTFSIYCGPSILKVESAYSR